MTHEFRLSIIIPVYNAERFIRTAIESVLIQKVKEIEIILVNDGSNDRSKQICEEYKSENVRCIFIEHAGTGHARNVGIKEAQGEWIIFLDSDDLILNETLDEKFLLYLETMNTKEIDLIVTPRVDCDFELKKNPCIIFPEKLEEIKYHMPKMSFFTWVYRKEFLISKNVEFFEYQKQDIESAFRFRCFSRTDNIYIDRTKLFYLHRNNPSSNTNTWKENEMLEVKVKVYWELLKETDDLETCDWLYDRCSFMILRLIKHYKIFGMREDSLDEQGLLKLLRLFWEEDYKPCNITYKSRIDGWLIRNLARQGILWKYYLKMCKEKEYKSSSEKIENGDLQSEKTDIVLERLKQCSESVKKQIGERD